jgi:hypothetical protein
MIDMLTVQGKFGIKAVPETTRRTADRRFGGVYKLIALNGRLLSVVILDAH